MNAERAVLAGGCFWGMQDLFRRQEGVISTRFGYTGGDVPNATYSHYGSHAETFEITFDPAKTSYRLLLEFFFQIRDPTTRNRQGNVGGRVTPPSTTRANNNSGSRRTPLPTRRRLAFGQARWLPKSSRAGPFWEVELEHPDYLERYPDCYTCHFIRPRWRVPIRASAGRGA